jgi:hypothetical protein
MRRDRATGEAIVLQLPHSPAVYRVRYPTSWFHRWRYPRAAWAALREVMPWEAFGLAAVAGAAVWFRYGSDLGVAAGLSLALGLATLQLFRTRTLATASHIVEERGLILRRRTVTAIARIREGHVEYPEGVPETFGDVVLDTEDGPLRVRAVAEPEVVLRRLLEMRDGHGEALRAGSGTGTRNPRADGARD